MPPSRFLRWSIAALAVLLVGCGGDDTSPAVTATEVAASSSTSSSSTSSSSTSSTVTVPVASAVPVATAPTTLPVPEGTTLRVADQFGLFAGVLGLAGMDQAMPYAVEYTTLSPGIVQLQAFRAGEVDLGVVSPLGLVQAAAGDVDVHAVARWRTDFALSALVTAPGAAGISDWTDLRGKRVAFQRDAMGEALVMLALDAAGMSLDDIDVVDVPTAQVGTALRGGDADAGVTSEPFVSAYLEENPAAGYVVGIENPMAQSTLIVASDDALTDPALAAAAAEYLSRLDRAFTKLTSDRATFADLVTTVWNLDRTYVERVLEGSDGVRMQGVPGDLSASYQRLSELLAARGDIDADLDTSKLFDPRFNGLFRS